MFNSVAPWPVVRVFSASKTDFVRHCLSSVEQSRLQMSRRKNDSRRFDVSASIFLLPEMTSSSSSTSSNRKILSEKTSTEKFEED